MFNLELTVYGDSRYKEGMSTELTTRPLCPACNSTKVGTLAKEIRNDTAWRCASCGETFRALQEDQATVAREYVLAPRKLKI